ncbi:MAG: glycoside hydrolase family 31 protein [Thermofilaceae archaeon]
MTVEVQLGPYVTRVTVYAPNIVRVTHSPPGVAPARSFVVVREPGATPFKVEEIDDCTVVRTSELEVILDRRFCTIEFRWSGGSLFERDRELRRVKVLGEETNSLKQEFSLEEREAIFGLGQHAGYSAHTGLNYAGRVVYLAQRNTDIAVPFMVSSRGYGLLWDNYSMGVLEFKRGRLRVWFEAGDALDYFFILGPSLDRVIAGYRWLTGAPPLLPKYAFGFWQSKERYMTQDEIVSVVREFRKRGIPLDIIVQDWQYWGRYGWNAFKFDEKNYPDPEKMVKEIHELGARIAISIWPFFGEETEIRREAEELGHLVPGTGLVNVFSEAARRWFWEKIRDTFFRIGIDGYWLDATEPEVKPMLVYASWQRELKVNGGRMFKYLNLWPLLEAKAVYEGQRSESNKRVLILTRSGFAGIQRYGVINWSGDITSDWTTLRAQVWAGLNYCLSGLPWWCTDIGGFFSGSPDSEGYREIFVRWFQWGVFCPIFRVHGTYFPKEPWRFGPEVERILVDYIKLRYRLLPYIYSLAWKVHSEGYTMMRHLAMDFPDDPEALEVDDEFMFGPFLLIAPVTTPSTYERDVYLPSGLWYDFWTGESYSGGRYVRVPSPLDRIPVFVRAGAILPLAPPGLQSSMERVDGLELRIYPGSDGRFELYDDDGETYDYEKGVYALVPIAWRDPEASLIVGEKRGAYELPELKLNVVIVEEGRGVGLAEVKDPDASVIYKGAKIELKNLKR